MDKQHFDHHFNHCQNNPLDETFVFEQGHLDVDHSTY